ncbi:LOW QUALITY PROTEIN: alpha/beta hydrolase [Colletotrichum tofieldiae]|nr:LOW QUALITY PROTEIN: alpha/beta hydrolase [Colletotrichum tofieldiae]
MRSFITLVSLLGLCALPTLAQNPHHAIDPALFPGITPAPNSYGTIATQSSITDPRKPKKVKGNCGQPTVDLAIVKLPYVPVAGGPAHQGAVHVSLGGWSSSSTNFLVRFGEDYAPLFAGYDLLAIDYRGWGWSTPAFRCFASEDERKQFALSEPQLLGADDAAYAAREKRAEEFAKKCKKNGEDVGRFMGTYSNAVDHHTVMRAENRTKMGFWGISSGPTWGRPLRKCTPRLSTSFSLTVGCLLLFTPSPALCWDRICSQAFAGPAPSSLAYTVTSAQPSQIKDAERGLDAFFYTCAAGKLLLCGVFNDDSRTPNPLQRPRDEAQDRPLSVTGTDKKFDWSALHTFLTTAIHGPGWFPVLGGVFSEVEAGAAGGWIGYVMTSGILAGVCTDEGRHLKGKDDFKSYFKSMTDAAPSVASIFSEWRLVCSKWKIDPINRIDDASGGPVKTQGKFVVLNGIGDPASSVEGAKGVAARFSPSVLVKDLAAGHTSFTASSNCLFGVFYTFFVLGQMPAEGTTCGDVFAPPFGVQLPSSF